MTPAIADEDLAGQRADLFQGHSIVRNVLAPAGAGPCTGPCCGHPALCVRGGYEMCDECGWEDDGQDDHDSAVVRGGPNGRFSLDEARTQYQQSGRSRGTHVPPADPQ